MYLIQIQIRNKTKNKKNAGVKIDTKFSLAVHVIILISESVNPINSDQMAESVGTNSSYIRKILALLKKECSVIKENELFL